MNLVFTDEFEPKKVEPPNSFEQLCRLQRELFVAKRSKPLKFFYLDPEGDIVSVSSDEDLKEAYACFPGEKIVYLTLVEEVVPEKVQATLE